VILKIRGSHWTSSTNLRLLFVRDFFLTLNKKTGPWKMTTESSSTGTGFIVDNNRILTNAHVVHRGQSILCRPQSGSKKFECVVESISLPLDLAVLTVVTDEEDFFRNKTPLQLVEAGFEYLPNLDDNVTAVGFPQGGDQISVTRGVVSRITHTGEVLRIQIDAAINPGNSGGPVFNESGRVVGVASSVLRNSSNIGYIIPATIIRLFFDSTADTGGKCNAAMRTSDNKFGYCGVASSGIWKIQTLDNPTLRTYLGIDKREGGVRIVSVDPMGACQNTNTNTLLVQPDDVLLSVNGVPIGEDGTVQLPGRPEERIFFTALVSSQLPMKPLEVEVIRNGELVQTTIYPKPRLYLCPHVDGYDSPDPPEYLICGGFVFIVLTLPWLRAKKKYNHLLSYYGGPQPEEGRQVVMLGSVLASTVNVGYHGLAGYVLRTFQDTEVFNLQHLATMVESCTAPLLEYRLTATPPIQSESDNNHSPNGHTDGEAEQKVTVPRKDEVLAVLDRENCKKMDPTLRKAHLIASPCSQGIKFNW